MKIKRVNEMFFDNSRIMDNEIRFYLINPKTNKGFAFDVVKEDKEKLEEIFKRNDVRYEVDDNSGELPF